MSPCSTTRGDLRAVPGVNSAIVLPIMGAPWLEPAQDRLDPVLDPLQPLLQLDDLLGHAGELAARGEVERRSSLLQRLLAGLLHRRLGGQHLSSERPICWANPSVFIAWPSTRDHASIH